MPLRDRRQRFVEEYLVDLNATQAARRAGYAEPTANREGSRLLSNVDVQDAIAAAMRERSLRVKMDADEVLLRLARLARACMQDYAEWGPNGVTLKDSATMSAEAAACVAEVSQTVTESGGSLRFKLHDKVAALELCGRHLGLFKDVHEVHFASGVPLSVEDVEEGRRRAEAYRQRRLSAVRDTNGHASSNGNGAADPRSP